MKKKYFCRILSALLAFLMTVTAMPLNAIALIADTSPDLGLSAGGPVSENPTNGNEDTVVLPNGATENMMSYQKWDGTTATALNGDGSESNPYVISSGAELMYFANQVNEGNTYEGKRILLTENIDMDMFNKGATWTPIGVSASAPFMGTFVGDLHEVINLNITYDSGKAADSETYYIGFFGYVKNATVQDFGIYNYKLNQTYNYDTEIGAMVAHAENSKIANCYANGDISALFENTNTNPLDRHEDDVIMMFSVPTELNYTNEHGQGVIIDLRGARSAVNTTMIIKGDVSAVKIIGDVGVTYTGFNIVVSAHNRFAVYIELQDCNLMGNSSNGTIYCDNSRSIQIESSGTSNVISTSGSASAVNAPKSAVCFSGNANLTLQGGNGANGSSKGQSGYDGKAAISCNQLHISLSNTFTAIGGNGGNGAEGTIGATGATNYNKTFDKYVYGIFGIEIQQIWHYNQAYTGGTGGNGGAGGNGGLPIDCKALRITDGTIQLKHGNGGNGGKGGKGGTGGQGAPYKGSASGVSYLTCYDPGMGGNGGTGGTGGKGGCSVTVQYGIDYDNIVITGGSNGKGGVGGNPGDPGRGGSGGVTTATANEHSATDAYWGDPGSRGKDETGINKVYIEQYIYSSEGLTFDAPLSSATLTIGGFIGFVDAVSTVDLCASVINQISFMPTASHNTEFINTLYDYNTAICGHLIGKYETGATIQNSIAAYYDESGTLCKYYNIVTADGKESIHYESWFGEGELNNAAMEVDVLNNNTDNVGLIYDNGISSAGKLLSYRTVLRNQINTKCALVIPDYVFDGRFITAVAQIGNAALSNNEFITSVKVGQNVTSIGDSAFASCKALETVILGENVTKIGYNLLSNCNAIESITIGKSLTTIPELKNETTPFGINKEKAKDFESYIVSAESTAFKAVDGILYELFELKDLNGGLSKYLTVAVIDAPTNVNITNYTPLDHVVRIYANAFSHNQNIESVDLEYIRQIGDFAFYNASNLETVTFGTPDEYYIGENGNWYIIEYVYDSDNSTTTATPQDTGIVALPTQTPYIGSDDYWYIGSVKTEISSLFTILDKQYEVQTEHYSQAIGNNAFNGCSSLSKINLESENIKKIGSSAFVNCATGYGTAPLKLTLGKNITILGEDYDSDYNKSEDALKNFFGVFEGANIESFAVVEGNPKFCAVDGVLYLKKGQNADSKEQLWLIAYPKSNPSDFFEVPSLEHEIVVQIAKNAFSGASYLKEIVVSNGVEIVDDYAFQNTKIISVTFGESVSQIGRTYKGTGDMFVGCNSLSAIYVDPNNKVYSDLFGVLYNKDQTTLIKYPQAKAGLEFTAPQSVSEVHANAFAGNTNIRRVTFESAIHTVGDDAFFGCEGLYIVYFKVGDAPFTATNLEKNGTFHTNHGRGTIVCYGESTPAWESLRRPYTTTDGKVVLFTIEPFMGFPSAEDASTGYYAIVVIDKSGNPLNSVHVALGEQSATIGSNTFDESVKTQAGIAMFYNLEYGIPYKLSVVDNMGEYFPFENTEFYLDEYTRVTYITLSSVPTIIGVSAKYDVYNEEITSEVGLFGDVEIKGSVEEKTVDINSETAKINKHLTSSVDITVSCGVDKGTTIQAIRLLQDGEIIQEYPYDDLGDKTTRRSENITVTIETEKLADEQDVYAVVVLQNDLGEVQKVQVKLHLHVFTFAPARVELPTGNHSVTIKMPDELKKLLGIDKLSPFGENEKLNVITILSEDTYRIAVEYNREELKKFGFNQAEGKDIIDLWEEWINDNRLFSATENKSKGELGFSFGGFVEQKYRGLKDTGDPDILISSGLKGSLEFTYGAGTTLTLVIVPIRLDVEVTITGELELTLEFDEERAHTLLPSGGELDFAFTGKIDFYAGIGCALASAGVYGNVKLYFLVELLPHPDLEKFTLQTDLGVYVKYDGLFIKWKKTWSARDLFGIPYEWVIYDCDKETVDVEATNNVILTNLLREENYIIATSSFDPANEVFTLGGLQATQDSAYAGISPKMIQVGDLVYIVYQEDLNGYNNNYDSYNYQKIVYQTYNTVTSEFSEVYVLEDNGLADGSFEVYYNGTDAVIAYTQLNKKLNTDNIEDMSGYVGSLEVKTAVLRNGVFVVSDDNNDNIADTLTHDEFYDMHLRIGEINGKIAAIWVQNTENTLFGTTENSGASIWFSTYDGSRWSTPSCLKSNLGTITDIELENGYIAYITDENNDLATAVVNGETVEGCMDDRVITLLNVASSTSTASAPDAYLDVSVIDGNFVYYLDNNLHVISSTNGEFVMNSDSNAKLFTAPIESLSEAYTLLEDANGNAKAILYIVTEEKSSNIYGIFCENGKWGTPIKLTDYTDGFYVNSYDVIDRGSEMLLSVLVAQPDMSVAQDTEEYAEVTEVYTFDTCEVEYPTDYTVGKAEFDYDSLAPQQDTVLTIPVVNNGYQALDASEIGLSITVTVTDQDKTTSITFPYSVLGFYDKNGTALENGKLLSGGTGYLKVKFNPGAAREEQYVVKVNDTAQEITLWYSDFVVNGKQVLIGNTYYIVMLVSNQGHLAGSYNISAVIDRDTYVDENGNVVELDPGTLVWNNNGKAVSLAAGNSQYFLVPLETTLGEDSRLVEIDVDADAEYMSSNNLTKINVTTEEDLSAQVPLSVNSAVIDRTTANGEVLEITFEEGYTLKAILVNGIAYTGAYSVSDNTITLDKASMASVFSENGKYVLTLSFANNADSKIDQYANVALTLTQTFTATWVVDGVEINTESYEIGTTPVQKDPIKQSDGQYHYAFAGWDRNGDGVADALSAIEGDTTYVAIFTTETRSYEVVWNVNGTATQQKSWLYGSIPSYEGVPQKESDTQYDYVFAGWDRTIVAVTENVTYTAVFDAVLRKYTVTTIVDGVTTTMRVEYGTVPSLTTPTKSSDAQYHYSFAGWSPAVSAVYGNQTYEAKFNQTVRQYTVTWNIDGTETQATYEYGTMPVYEETPSKAGDAQYTYRFTGWDSEILIVTSDVTYTAVFERSVNRYTVFFLVNGTTYSAKYEYGVLPTCKGELAKPADETYRYVFSGWDREILPVTGEATYEAQFDAIPLGKMTIGNTESHTGWLCEFTTTLTISQVENLSETTITVYYNPALVTLKSYRCINGTEITAESDGSITVQISGLTANECRDILDLTFATLAGTEIGAFDFIDAYSEDTLTSKLGKLTVYQAGDVNMDGEINDDDVTYARKHLAGWNDCEAINGLADVNKDGTVNAIDVALLKRYLANWDGIVLQ